ncbi:MAG: cysteine synthase family protein [Deltaproteobacteria bacterium]|nr:cysteine synthase family protein [Deltaproteobacteria bacterium]
MQEPRLDARQYSGSCSDLVDRCAQGEVSFTVAAEPGNTPLVSIEGVFAKLECVNPCSSIKDRIAKYIIEQSERRGLLRPGMKIVEATSGNTGIAFSYFGARKNYSVTIVMPENMTDERKGIIRSMGAELVLCNASDFAEAVRIRDQMAQDPNVFNPDQFSNPLNVECHEKTTGHEIISQIGEFAPIHAFVAGVGTGGTLIGVGKALRKILNPIHLVAVEPSESAVMSGGCPGVHGIQGIGDGFIPPIASDGKGGLHPMIDEVITVSTQEAHEAAVLIREKYGYCVGVSSGANFVAAKRLLKKFKTVVTVFPDGYSKYQSHGLKHSGKGRCPFEEPRQNIARKS